MRKIIDSFKTSGGKHCITSSLRQVFEYYNYMITEEMIFGIASGLDFVYINLEKSPMISGRTKPFVFERKLSERLNMEIKCKSSSNYNNVFDKTIKIINDNKPVVVYVDMFYLKYLNLEEDSHFGGHAIVIFGYDDKENKFYISDRDNSDNPIRTPMGYISKDYHLVNYFEIEEARSSNYRPFPAKNKYLDIKLDKCRKVTPNIIKAAIRETCNNMLNAPAQLLGLNGINKFSKEILKWSKFEDVKLRKAGITNYFQVNADGGTGGGIFRRMYGDFLKEASIILKSREIKEVGEEFINISEKWDKVGEFMWKLYESGDKQLLIEMSGIIKEIHKDETYALSKLYQSVSQSD